MVNSSPDAPKKAKKRKVNVKPNLIERKPKSKTTTNETENAANSYYVHSSDDETLADLLAELKRKNTLPLPPIDNINVANMATSSNNAVQTTSNQSSSQKKVVDEQMNIDDSDIHQSSQKNEEAPLSKKKVKIPPINVVGNQQPKDIIRLITKSGITDFQMKSLPGKKHAILLNDIDQYQEVKELLTEAKFKYFTYTPKHLKNQTYVLKGLHHSEDVDEILKCLKFHCSDTLQIIKVTRFSTRRSTANKTILPFFLVHISANSDAKQLVNIKRLNYQVVQWEKLKKGGILQCKNCQRFGHAATNCNLGYRCVKCNQSHLPGECSIVETNINKSNIFCVTCNAFGHPASYRGCPNYKNMIVRLRKKIELQKEQKQLRQRAVNRFTRPSVSFADLFRPTAPQQSHQNGVSMPSAQPNNLEHLISSMRDSILASMKNQFDIFSKALNDQKLRIDALYDALNLETVNYA